ncbi:MAG TPA: hypothetical protein VN829_04465 [Dongiaceae bacterium]|nr:hypothetical protein [Dongiaceae bacterium]
MQATVEKFQELQARCDEGIALTEDQRQFGDQIWIDIETRLKEFHKLKETYRELEAAQAELTLIEWWLTRQPTACWPEKFTRVALLHDYMNANK